MLILLGLLAAMFAWPGEKHASPVPPSGGLPEPHAGPSPETSSVDAWLHDLEDPSATLATRQAAAHALTTTLTPEQQAYLLGLCDKGDPTACAVVHGTAPDFENS